MSATTFDPPSPASTILLVEDEVLMRHMLADCLRECGYRVIEASNAMEAAEVLADAAVDLCVVGRLERKFGDPAQMAERIKATLASAARSARHTSPVA